MKVAICDDSDAYLQKISQLLSKFCKEHSIDCNPVFYESGDALLNSKSLDFDVIFLDVHMPGPDGIEVAHVLRRSNQHVFIVFITSFIEFAPRGYEVDAVRYLLKDKLELTFDGCMKAVFNLVKSREKRVLFKFMEGDVYLVLSSLIYVESDKHKLSFHVLEKDKPYTMYQRLDEIDTRIDSSSFLRIHKSYLVNMNHIEVVTRYNVTMSDGTNLTIPKNKFPEVQKRYILFKG